MPVSLFKILKTKSLTVDLHQEIINLKRDNDKAWLLVKKLEEENTALQNGLNNCVKDFNLKLIKEIKNNTRKYLKKIREQKKKNQRLKKFIVTNCDLTITALNLLIKNNFNNRQS